MSNIVNGMEFNARFEDDKKSNLVIVLGNFLVWIFHIGLHPKMALQKGRL